MSSGRSPRPVRQNRWARRAATSSARTGSTQKSSKWSSRRWRSASWAAPTTSSSGRRGTSRARTSRHRANAPVASGSAHTTAPAQPSSGSSVSACSGRAMAFQG